MEEEKEMEEGLFKVRSYLGCLGEGVKLPTRNFLPLLKFLYPSMIVGALVAIGGVSVFNFMMRCVADADLFGMLVGLNMFFVVLYLAAGFYWGQFAVAVSHYVRTGSLMNLKLRRYRKDVMKAFGRSCRLFAPWCIIFMCAGSVFVWGWLASSGALTGWVTLAVVVFLWLLLYVPYQGVVCDGLFGESCGFGKSLTGMKDGFRNWGAFFVVLLCGGGLSVLVMLLSCLPSLILALVKVQAFRAETMGDVTDLPSCFTAWMMVCGVLASFFSNIGTWLTMFPLSFLYGSIETGKKEKEKYEEEERLYQKGSH